MLEVAGAMARAVVGEVLTDKEQLKLVDRKLEALEKQRGPRGQK